MPPPREILQYPCPICNSKHALRKCSRFEKMSVTFRLRVVDGQGVCRNCLALSHRTWQCTSTAKCAKCYAGHHTMLHHDERQDIVSAEERWDRLTFPYGRHNVTLKPTFEVMVQTLKGEVPLRAVFEAAQHCSSITKTSARAVDAVLIYAEAQPYCHLRLKSRHVGGRAIMVSFKVDVGIYGQCPPVQADPTPVYVFHPKLPMADRDFHNPIFVDMILGADVATRVLWDDTKVIHGVPKAVSTIFGWAFEGECPRED